MAAAPVRVGTLPLGARSSAWLLTHTYCVKPTAIALKSVGLRGGLVVPPKRELAQGTGDVHSAHRRKPDVCCCLCRFTGGARTPSSSINGPCTGPRDY